jgi:hypothetical protein
VQSTALAASKIESGSRQKLPELRPNNRKLMGGNSGFTIVAATHADEGPLLDEAMRSEPFSPGRVNGGCINGKGPVWVRAKACGSQDARAFEIASHDGPELFV